MASSFRSTLPWIAVVFPIIVFASVLSFGFLSTLLTSLVLVSSSLFLTFSNRKPVGRSVNEKYSRHVDEIESKVQPESEIVAVKKETQEGKVGENVNGYFVRSPYFLSETESLDRSSTSEDSEGDNLGQVPATSEDSISDDDSLIEIDLPGGHYVRPEEDEPNICHLQMQQKLPNFFPNSIFRQQSFTDMFSEINEVNEEENLIEIDISMGSIKCSRFEIEA